MEYKVHIPVMKEKVGEIFKDIKGIVVDATIGSGGHSEYLLKINKDIRIIGVDYHVSAVEFVKKRLEPFKDRVHIFHTNFVNIRDVLKKLSINKINGFFMDLGLSLSQALGEEGLSYTVDGPLSFSISGDTDLRQVLGNMSTHEIEEIIRKYGEEKYAKRIAKSIVENWSDITTTVKLKEIIERAVPARSRKKSVMRTFQAFRIFINREIDNIRDFLALVTEIVERGSRWAIITYHSLEERVVKEWIKRNPQVKMDGILIPDDDEVKRNRAARSARLRFGSIE